MKFLAVSLVALFIASHAHSAAPDALSPPGPWQNAPKLDEPSGNIVRVSTESQLLKAVLNIRSNTTILIAPGTYELTRSLYITGGVKNIALRGDADERGKVIIKGKGMRNKNSGNASIGILVGDATDVLIANLSIGDFWFHPIALQGHEGCKRVRMFNLRLFDAGEQFLKSNPDKKGRGVDDCIVEYCVFEFTDTSRHFYTQGMSVHGAANWVVRNNLFRNIRGPKGDSSVGGCVDFWKGSRNTTVEGNLIINCRMGIRFGIVNGQKLNGVHDHEGGIIRNNIIWRKPGAVENPDGGIMVWDSPGTKVLHNTVILNDTYAPGVIEYRWSKNVEVANNLIDGRVWKREEAEGKEVNNGLVKVRAIFADAARGDLRLLPRAFDVFQKLPALAECPRDITGKKRGDETMPGAYDSAAMK